MHPFVFCSVMVLITYSGRLDERYVCALEGCAHRTQTRERGRLKTLEVGEKRGVLRICC